MLRKALKFWEGKHDSNCTAVPETRASILRRPTFSEVTTLATQSLNWVVLISALRRQKQADVCMFEASWSTKGLPEHRNSVSKTKEKEKEERKKKEKKTSL